MGHLLENRLFFLYCICMMIKNVTNATTTATSIKSIINSNNNSTNSLGLLLNGEHSFKCFMYIHSFNT